MPQTSFALMTTLGRAKEAAALANATKITITEIAIGDGPTVPSGGETALYHEVARKTISGHGTVVGADNVAYFDCYLAAGDGPYTIREAGLYDDAGDLIAIAHYDPPISKPVPESGQTVDATVRLEVAFSNVASIVIVIDPAMKVALQRLSRLPWIPIIELARNNPPETPLIGDVYTTGDNPTGAWAGQVGKVVEYTIAGWAILAPPNGHGVGLPDGRVFIRTNGSYVEKIAIDVQSGKWLYGVDTGAANALVVALTPRLRAYTAGLLAHIKVNNKNTVTAPTINIDGLGVKTITYGDGSSLQVGDLVAGDVVSLTYDGAKFILGPSRTSALNAQRSQVVADRGGSSQSIPAEVFTKIVNYGTTNIRTNGGTTFVGGVMTVGPDDGGLWFIAGHVRQPITTQSGFSNGLHVNNSSSPIVTDGANSAANGSTVHGSVARLINLVPGDTVDQRVIQTTGSTVTLNDIYDFSAVRLGAS